jgi:hypothetical protein
MCRRHCELFDRALQIARGMYKDVVEVYISNLELVVLMLTNMRDVVGGFAWSGPCLFRRFRFCGNVVFG